MNTAATAPSSTRSHRPAPLRGVEAMIEAEHGERVRNGRALQWVIGMAFLVAAFLLLSGIAQVARTQVQKGQQLHAQQTAARANLPATHDASFMDGSTSVAANDQARWSGLTPVAYAR